MGRLKGLPPRVAPLGPRVGYLDHSRDAARQKIRLGRRLQSTARWRRLRLQVLREAGFACARCGFMDGTGAKLVADHIEMHGDDLALFWDRANLQCLCTWCHSGAKQREEIAARGA